MASQGQMLKASVAIRAYSNSSTKATPLQTPLLLEMTMEKTVKLCLRTMLLLVLLQTSAVSGDVGTASAYYSPYIPTRCWGNDQSRFPANSMFVSVSEVMWDNGAACGRRYRVRCLAGDARPCKAGYVDVVVVDACRRFPCPSTLLLSADAYGAISRNPSQRVSVEYIQI